MRPNYYKCKEVRRQSKREKRINKYFELLRFSDILLSTIKEFTSNIKEEKKEKENKNKI
jgi:hypothetical protein